MPRENQSEIFIRLLNDALQADRLIRKSAKSHNLKHNANRPSRMFQPENDDAVLAYGPLDCVQLMMSGPTGLKNG